MSTSPNSGAWAEDVDLVPWLLGVHFHRPRYPGRFLLALSSAARAASPAEYYVLRPVLVSAAAAHPEFHWEPASSPANGR